MDVLLGKDVYRGDIFCIPNRWVLIIDPEYHLGTAEVKSGIVKLSSESHGEFLEKSAGVKVNSAVEFTGDLASLEHGPIITS